MDRGGRRCPRCRRVSYNSQGARGTPLRQLWVCLTPLDLLPNLCLPWICQPCRQRALPPGIAWFPRSADLTLDALNCGGDGGQIRDVELERAGVSVDRPGRSIAVLEIARPEQHSEAVRREILRNLKTDSLISPGDQGDGFALHGNLPFSLIVEQGISFLKTNRPGFLRRAHVAERPPSPDAHPGRRAGVSLQGAGERYPPAAPARTGPG